MNQAALWAGIALAILGAGKFSYAGGKYPDAEKIPLIAILGIAEIAISAVFFITAYTFK